MNRIITQVNHCDPDLAVKKEVNNTSNSLPDNHLPFSSLNDIHLRFLCPNDIDIVQNLCQDWFPINYPQCWYEEVTSASSRFYSLAAIYHDNIIGLIVAQIKSFQYLNNEDKDILSINIMARNTYDNTADIAYILSLGVARQYRRNGIATVLLTALLDYVTKPERKSIKAVFLHVLTTNTDAIMFYERNKFQLHSFLPNYYLIKGECKDGFTYVLYINGGRKPFNILDYFKTYVVEQVKRFCLWFVLNIQAAVYNFLGHHPKSDQYKYNEHFA